MTNNLLRSTRNKTIAVLMASTLAFTGCSNNQEAAGPIDPTDLPVEHGFGLERSYENARAVADRADAIVIATFDNAIDAWRLPKDPEGDFEGATEHVGLAFTIVETLSGSTQKAEREADLVISWPAYRLTPETSERREARIVFKEVDFMSLKPGTQYLIAVIYNEDLDSYQLLNTSMLSTIDEKGGLDPLGESHGGFAELDVTDVTEFRVALPDKAS